MKARLLGHVLLLFPPDKKENGDIALIDVEIKNGGMIGKMFKEFNYEVRKNVIDVFIIEIPKWLKEKFVVKKNYAKARISEFYAKKEGSEPIIYGYVLEIYPRF
ncbi:MAG: hypothetical protein COU81_00610 [Candidatus Portnoybacteria bacterium CG10_big_fil_rev_8_21_14_0_10_36_7]|uniref:Uncharacterized protein n=1 Tax=Candidatus Portnoybacteria bacterium CG10_big_fil_rev_8_21_14_0_10_36_7 TaxID=1974812 RepID=A0A2M8KEX7_9BACT|nr:MAG: hypothetical protein COU81_00610 [Candidatus Portnoybacteria bacterium CG10_big_fil_rev_8_21_14_0_10_36_7]